MGCGHFAAVLKFAVESSLETAAIARLGQASEATLFPIHYSLVPIPFVSACRYLANVSN